MKKYDKYKPVELGWLDSVPAHWEVKQLKHIVGLNSGDSITAETIYPEGPYSVFGGNGLRGYTTSFTHEGHFVLIGRQGALCGNINYAQGAFFASEHALVANPKVEFATTWLGELLRTMNLGQYSQAAAQPGLSADRLQKLNIPIPPLIEQRVIAEYLDRKTTQFNTLISQKEMLLQLLLLKRQALINEAVTQGLDHAAPLKPSGVAWLGYVPEHWDVKKLKYCVQLNSNEIEDDGTGLRIALENIESKTGKYIPTETAPFEGPGNSFKSGDVLFSKLRPYLAKALLAPQNGVAVGEILVLSPLEHIINNSFLLNRVLSPSFIEAVDSSTYGSKMPRASWNFIGEMKIAIPPLLEQKSIVDFIEDITGKINKATDAINAQIQTLKAYRQSLISEVVTGKVDVRPAAPAPEADLPLWMQ